MCGEACRALVRALELPAAKGLRSQQWKSLVARVCLSPCTLNDPTGMPLEPPISNPKQNRETTQGGCRGGIRNAKTHLELNLMRGVKGHKK